MKPSTVVELTEIEELEELRPATGATHGVFWGAILWAIIIIVLYAIFTAPVPR